MRNNTYVCGVSLLIIASMNLSAEEIKKDEIKVKNEKKPILFIKWAWF